MRERAGGVAAPEARSGAGVGRVAVFAEDAELVRELAPEEAAVARRQAVVTMLSLGTGRWEPDLLGEPAPGHLGYLVIEGLLARDVLLGKRGCAELLGRGDLLRPWDQNDGAYAPVPSRSEWTVFQPARLAVLDRGFAALVGRWPEVTEALLSRTLRRSRWLATLLAINSLPRVDARLLVLFWHLADRFGHVNRAGVYVPLDLTHETFARLVGAQRPSVTTALGELIRARAIARSDGGWILHGDPPQDFEGDLLKPPGDGQVRRPRPRDADAAGAG